MLYESPHIRVEAADGVATLWLEFPGSPVNGLTPGRLADFAEGLSAAAANPHVEILVLRSGMPAGFCGGHDPALLANLTTADTQFATTGQRLLNQLAALDVITVAFIEGPCLGPGLELALACDYRLAVAGPDSWVGFPDANAGLPPCWGGTVRLRQRLGRRANPLLAGQLLTAREARDCGLFDDAFCARRAKVELRTFLDQLQRRPRKCRSSWWPTRQETDFAELATERIAFRASLSSYRPISPMPSPGQDDLTEAVESAIRGRSVTLTVESDREATQHRDGLTRVVGEVLRRGRVTPLEAEQALKRIQIEVTSVSGKVMESRPTRRAAQMAA